MTFLVILAAALIALVAVVAVLVRRAPEGYQDAAGFHYGTPPERDVKAAVAPYVRGQR